MQPAWSEAVETAASRAAKSGNQADSTQQYLGPIEIGIRTRPRLRIPVTAASGMTQRLHCEDGAEAGLTLRYALVGLCSFGQWVGLSYRFHFALGDVVQGF